MRTRAKDSAKKRAAVGKKQSRPFVIKKLSHAQMKALSDLGMAVPKPGVARRFLLIEITGGKEKGHTGTVFGPDERETNTASLPGESVRRAEIIAHATEALDGQANALRWLLQPEPNLGGKAPLVVLTEGTPEEAEQVDELLYRFEYGMHV